MFVRLLFLLLLALNVGAAAWLMFGPVRADPAPPATDPGVAELRLWSETAKPLPPAQPQPALPAELPTAAPAAAGGAVPEPAAAGTAAPEPAAAGSATAAPAVAGSAALAPATGVTCRTLGPFTTRAGTQAALQALSPHVARIQYREQPVRRSHGYWVYLPAAPSRDAALDQARQLAAKGVHDYYVVTAGDTENTISLGLFNDEANANKRLVALEKLGFAARLEQRIDTEAAYWLDYAVPSGQAFDWRAWLPNRSDLDSRPIDCFGSEE